METKFRDELYAAQYPTEAVATINNIVGLGFPSPIVCWIYHTI